MNRIFQNRVEALTPTIRGIAQKASVNGYGVDAEDIFQEVVIRLYEIAGKEAGFSDQKDGYILRRAGWEARNIARKSRIEAFHLCDLEENEPEEGGEPEGVIFSCVISDDDTETEVTRRLKMKELARLSSWLSPVNQKIVALLFLGYSESEIARSLGVTPGAITQRKQTISRQFAPLMSM